MNTLANDLFGKLQKEEYECGDQFSHEDDPVVEGFKRVAAVLNTPGHHYGTATTFDWLIAKEIESLQPSEQQIQSFLDAAPDCYGFIRDTDTRAALVHGIYISKLASKLPSVTLTLHKPLAYFGSCFTGKRLIVNGRPGALSLYQLTSGVVTLNDGAGDTCAWDMEGGYLTIQHGAGKTLAAGMTGGTINCYGNAKDGVGNQAEHGTIQLLGGRRPILGVGCRAKVFHDGTRIT
jgi:hypothetical protein